MRIKCEVCKILNSGFAILKRYSFVLYYFVIHNWMQNMLLRMWKEGRTLMRICSDCLLISNTRNIGDLHRKCYHSSMLSYNNMSCHAISCHTITCTVMSCHVMSCHVMWYVWVWEQVIFQQQEYNESKAMLCNDGYHSCCVELNCSVWAHRQTDQPIIPVPVRCHTVSYRIMLHSTG